MAKTYQALHKETVDEQSMEEYRPEVHERSAPCCMIMSVNKCVRFEGLL